jgi:hypothetical protein
MLLLTICLVLAILLSVTILALVLVKNPPVIRIEVVPQIAQKSEPVVPEVVMPQELVDYIDVESEEHARAGRRQRARALYAEYRDWNIVRRALEREDNLET